MNSSTVDTRIMNAGEHEHLLVRFMAHDTRLLRFVGHCEGLIKINIGFISVIIRNNLVVVLFFVIKTLVCRMIH